MPKVLISTLVQGEPDLSYATLAIGSATTGAVGVRTGELITDLRSASGLSDEIGDDNFLYNMARKYWLADKKFETTLDYIFLAEEGGATVTTITSAFTGAATEDGTLTLTVGEREWTVTVDVLNTDLATDIVDAIVTALTGLNYFPFTASNVATGTLTLTSNVKGGIGQNVPVKIEGTIAGLTIGALTINAGSTPPLATGVKAILDGVKGAKYDIIIVEDEVVLTPIISMLDDYIILDNQNKSGALLVPDVDTFANLITASTTYNERNIQILGLETVANVDTEKSSNHLFATPCLFAGYIAGVLATCLTDGADCSEFLSSAKPTIVEGSPSNRSIPFADIVSDQYYVTQGKEWTQTEINLLEDSGVTVFYNNKGGNLVFGNFVSTYLKDADGNPDATYHFMNAWLISDFCNGYMFEMSKLQRHQRLASDTARANVISLLGDFYDTLSNVTADENGNQYQLLDAGGRQEYMDSVRETVTINFETGVVIVSKAIQSLLSQFRELRIFNKYQYLK